MTDLSLREDLLDKIRRLEPVIREHADESERQRHLADPIVDALRAAGLYRMMTPPELGGLGVDLITLYRVVEEIAAIDGSTGWCLFINGSCPLTGAFLPPNVAEEIYGEANAIGSGTVFPFGRAELADGGYQVSGRWAYASGAWHSNWHFAFCNVYEPGADEPVPGLGDIPMVVAPHLPRNDVELLDTWDVSGLSGTGSHDIVIDRFVPEDHVWTVGSGGADEGPYAGPLYRLPFLAAFAWPMAAVALGIARGAVDEMMSVAQTKRHPQSGALQTEQPLVQLQTAQATAKLESARSWLYHCLEGMWAKAQRSEPVPLEERALGQLAVTNATQEAAAAVQIAYRAGGASANYRRSPLQRSLRDANAVTQHFAAAPNQLLGAGAMLLGQPPQNPLLLI
jgi:alkylation response protein AidB-like acyl-CoA dehydrogenase